jgi:hypothetical protein
VTAGDRASPRRKKRVGYWGNAVSTKFVNLDALIRRADFRVVDDPADFEQMDRIPLFLLKKGLFYANLRKPDFQRETANWSPDQVVDLVRSCVSGDLVPAVILWQPSDNKFIYVIDGAHRLSALIAWVNDDYGDKEISRSFFENAIEAEQATAAAITRAQINRDIGSFVEHEKADEFPDKTRPFVAEQAARLTTLSVRVQWVKGNADKAEKSFFKINQAATPISPTEIRILEARKEPDAISSRAILRKGTGHKYWNEFGAENQKSIESLAATIYTTLFTPTYKLPIKTLDLPVAGKAYSSYALPMIFDFVNLVNGVIPLQAPVQEKRTRKPKLTEEQKEAEAAARSDQDGTKTLRYMRETLHLAQRISGTDQSSLGLHPAIYFYSVSGRHQPTAFLAIVGFMKEIEAKNALIAFTKSREQIEDFLLKYKDFINQIVGKQGGGLKPFYKLKDFYHLVFKAFRDGQDEQAVLKTLQDHPRFTFLKIRPTQDPEAVSPVFKGTTKSAVYLKTALNSPRERCMICGARTHVNSISIDHIIRKEDGGIGVIDNGQLTHPFCNSTVKN